MKNMLIILQVLVMAFLAKIFTTSTRPTFVRDTSDKPPVEQTSAHASSDFNTNIATSRIINSEQIVFFLNETATTRRLMVEESKLAVKYGATEAIRDYGKIMLRDQTKMLTEVKALARKRSIKLSSGLSQEQMQSLLDLRKTEASNFDKSFIKRVKSEHKRDVRRFKNDSESNDPEVARLSAKYRTLVKSHLDKIKELD
jgi:putative membrane protein